MANEKIDRALSLALLIFGLIWIFAGCIFLEPDINSNHWPTVEGTILDSGRWYSRGVPFTWFADFKYEIAGKNYQAADEGEKLGSPIFFWRGAAETYAHQKYPPGQKVIVYYDPLNPATAVLQPGIRYVTLVNVSFAIIILLCSFFLCLDRRNKVRIRVILLIHSIFGRFQADSSYL